MHQKTCLEGNDCSIDGAIRECWGFKAKFFVDVKFRKLQSNKFTQKSRMNDIRGVDDECKQKC